MIRLYFILFGLTFSLLQAISIDISLGDVINFEQKLNVDIDSNVESFSVRPKTHGFKSPQYYSLRLKNELMRGQKSHYIEMELIHHKLYLEDGLPDYIKEFEFTDGYNLLMGNYSVRSKNIGLRIGFGALIVHPDITIQGQEVNLEQPLRIYQKGGGLIPTFGKDNGYYLTGLAHQLGIFATKKINNKISGHIEAKVLGAWMLDSLEIKYRDDADNDRLFLIDRNNINCSDEGCCSRTR